MKKGVEMEVDAQPAKTAITAEQLLAQFETNKNATESNQPLVLQQVNMSLITCDERCITVYDANELTDFNDETLIGRTQNCLNQLFEKLAALPSESTEEGVVVKLPAPKTVLPRFKRLPKRDEFQSKWERFARVKGIQKQKRSRKVYDPDTERWKPRFGYDPEAKNNEKQSDWLIEVPTNGDPYEDQFAKRVNDKRERIAKNELQRLRNMSRKMRFNDSTQKPADWPTAESNRKANDWPTTDNNRKPAAWPSDNKNKGAAQKAKIGVGVLPEMIPDGSMARGTAQNRFTKLSRAHQDVKLAYENARVATASLGRFDQRTRRETNLEKSTKVLKNRSIKDPQINAKRVRFDDDSKATTKKGGAKANGHSSGGSGAVDVRSEKESYLRVLDSMAARRTATKPINDAALQKAANRATAQEQTERAQSKGVAGKGDSKSKRSGSQGHKSKFGGGKRKFEPKRFDQSDDRESKGGFKGGSKGGFKGGSKGSSFKGGSKGGSFKGGSKGGSFKGGSKGGSFKGGSKGGSKGGNKGGFKGGNKGRKGK